MHRWIWGIALALWAGAALAEDWAPVRDDQGVIAALSERTLIYDEHTMQRFGSGGDTQYVTDRFAEGRWAARGGQYCSVWPPSDIWTCYDLQVNGDRVRFVASDRSVSEGTYRQ